jgi:hypothetical protein
MMTAYREGNLGEGRKSDTGGAHGGPQDEGPIWLNRFDWLNRFESLRSRLHAVLRPSVPPQPVGRSGPVPRENVGCKPSLTLTPSLTPALTKEGPYRYRPIRNGVYVLEMAQPASCAAENTTAIDKANASTLQNCASGVTVTVRAEALQPAACKLAKTIANEAIVHTSCASEKAAFSLSISCATEGKDSTFGTRPAGRITLEGDGVGYGRNRALSNLGGKGCWPSAKADDRC